MKLSQLIICISMELGTLTIGHAFQDPSARKNNVLFDYVDTVSEEVGLETFESVSFEYVFSFARQLGQIERYNLKPTVFFNFVKEAVEVKNNFSYANGMSDDVFNDYVLPLRIRYESTARPEWRQVFKKMLEPHVKGKSVADAAELIFKHMAERIHLDSKFSYDLGYRGDLDPLATYRGKYGDEVDASILSCAALRSVGIAARLVYTPHIQSAQGGKVWLEYLDESGTWHSWVPGYAQQAPKDEHQRLLIASLRNKCGIIFAHPAAPMDVTESYLPQYKVNIQTPQDRSLNEQYNLAFFSDQLLRPIRGMELTSIRTRSPERKISTKLYWLFKVQNDLKVDGRQQTR